MIYMVSDIYNKSIWPEIRCIKSIEATWLWMSIPAQVWSSQWIENKDQLEMIDNLLPLSNHLLRWFQSSEYTVSHCNSSHSLTNCIVRNVFRFGLKTLMTIIRHRVCLSIQLSSINSLTWLAANVALYDKSTIYPPPPYSVFSTPNDAGAEESWYSYLHNYA